MANKTLVEVVQDRPFSEYNEWWSVGHYFVKFMSESIVTEWTRLPGNTGSRASIHDNVEAYLNMVYNRKIRPELVESFIDSARAEPIQSGEFDALSYAFYRSAFELIEQHSDRCTEEIKRERRLFTKRVGKIFFGHIHAHLNIELPGGLESQSQVKQVSSCIDQVGEFLNEQGYLRSHFAFRFDVDLDHQGNHIAQANTDVIDNLKNDGTAYALYEMGYPIILPSAVYLYHTMGEAQHHSSRTIEDLFEVLGYDARETDDFDPIGYPSKMVVELWEIRRQ
jgi:hypothetical protein